MEMDIANLGSSQQYWFCRRVVVFYNNRVVKVIGMEVGQFSITCQFKKVVQEFMIQL